MFTLGAFLIVDSAHSGVMQNAGDGGLEKCPSEIWGAAFRQFGFGAGKLSGLADGRVDACKGNELLGRLKAVYVANR